MTNKNCPRHRRACHPLLEPLELRLLLSYSPPADPRITTNLDPNWKFFRADAAGAETVPFNDSAWSAISLPHTWNNLDGQDGGSNYYRGIGWYRRHLTPDAALAGKSLYLSFAGADLVTDLYVNGVFVGEHKGGYSVFGWDISSYLVIGADNLLAVKVSNASDPNTAPLAGDYTMDGGLYRDVSLIATDPQHVALQEFVPADSTGVGPSVSYWIATPGVYLTPTNVTSASANLSVATVLRNDASSSHSLTVVSDIVDAAGNLVTELTSTQSVPAGANLRVTQNTVITNPHLWNGLTDPYLYTVYVSVLDAGILQDVTQQPLGIRSFTVDPNLGAFLNGQYIDLHGVSFHQDRLNEGWAITTADQIQDVDLIQEMGVNFVRLSHYQHPQETYTLLDQRGIAAWSEIPLNGTGVGSMPATSIFLDNAKEQLQEMIRQNYNHPAVLVWGILNELSATATNQSIVTALNTLAHQEDPTRDTTAASNQTPTAAISQITDLTGFNEYLGWYGGSYNDIGPWLDAAHASVPSLAIGLSEFGAGAALTQHADNPSPPPPYGSPHPEEYQNLFEEAYWAALKTRPFVWEKTVWNMFDFAVNGRNEGDTPGRNDKGLVSYDRTTRKDAFYFYKANWSTSPVLYITSRRFTNRSSATIPVKIYANMDSVTLTVNGVLIGTLTSVNVTDGVFLWNNISIKDGSNLIEVTGTRAGQPYTDSVTFTNTLPLPHLAALTGTPYARINFQPTGTPAYTGYLQDNGLAFGVRTGGLSYGWNATNTSNTRDRNNAISPDQRYDTLIQMQHSGTFTWEIALPNGTYDVHLVAGDPSFFDSTHVLDLEGRLALSGTPTSTSPWIESFVRVTVSDGRLTLSADAAGNNDKIDFIEINTAANSAPILAAPATAPSPVTSPTTPLAVLGNDDTGESNLLYAWSILAKPANAPDPTFSLNNTNAAKNTTASFTQSGPYTLRATITDPAGLTTTSDVSLNVTFGFTGISPAANYHILYTGGATYNLFVDTATVTFATDLAPTTNTVNLTLAPNTTAIFNTTQHLATLTIPNGATVQLPDGFGHNVLRLTSLSLTGTAKLNLFSNDLLLDYTNTPSPATTIEALVKTGYNSGNWLGNAITSSSSAANPGKYTLAVLDNLLRSPPMNTFDGIDTSSHRQVLVKFTYIDDFDLDGLVTSNDAITFAAHYSEGKSATHRIGDLNYNSIFDSNDAILFAVNYNESLPQIPPPAPLTTPFTAATKSPVSSTLNAKIAASLPAKPLAASPAPLTAKTKSLPPTPPIVLPPSKKPKPPQLDA